MTSACLFPTGPDFGGGSTSTSYQCETDADCGSSNSCRQYQCVGHACTSTDVPDGVPAPSSGSALVCQKLVCDGHGSTRAEPDSTALPTYAAPACKKNTCDASGHPLLAPDPTNVPAPTTTPCKQTTCDASGNAVLAPDPSNVPADTPNDCQVQGCDANGNVTRTPDTADLPKDTRGDCMKDTCTASGGTTKAVDDTDVPAPTTCYAYSCTNGTPKSTPINPTTKCSDLGFVCGADGTCQTCPAPDAACTDTGPGARASTSAHDFGGIGRTDSGGRYFCGAVPSGQAEYYTYYDDGSGFLASFDPYFEILPQTAAKMCVYFDCSSISCPGGTTSDALDGHPGCCWDAAAGAYTGHRIDFCTGARVTLKVSTAAACAGYEAHFHD